MTGFFIPMELLQWNVNGFASVKLSQIKTYDCYQDLAAITLCETKSNLENLDEIAKITAIFPHDKWEYLYTSTGQGMLTLVRRSLDENVTIQLKEY